MALRASKKEYNNIYLTGDTHQFDLLQQIRKLLAKYTEEELNGSLFFVLGDFGLFWEQDWGFEELDILEQTTNIAKKYNFRIAFLAGNHENYNRLDKLALEPDLHSGSKNCHTLVHPYSKEDTMIDYWTDGIHEINDYTILTIGGGDSVDKHHRTPGISWWSQETITPERVDNVVNLINECKENDNSIDFIFSHDTADQIKETLFTLQPAVNMFKIDPQPSSVELNRVIRPYLTNKPSIFSSNRNLSTPDWYFGHYHTDFNFTYGPMLRGEDICSMRCNALYRQVVKLEDGLGEQFTKYKEEEDGERW